MATYPKLHHAVGGPEEQHLCVQQIRGFFSSGIRKRRDVFTVKIDVRAFSHERRKGVDFSGRMEINAQKRTVAPQDARQCGP